MKAPSVRFTLPAFVAGLLLSSLSLPSAAQQVHFTTLERPVIEQRLKSYKQKNPERESELKQLFTEAGCTPEHQSEQPVKGSKVPNVLCTLPGSTDRIVIVGGHFDKVDTGTGVIDNWSGASLLPSLFESLKAEPRRHTFLFIGFTDEEKGLFGSEYYAKHLSKEDIAKISAMVNIDSLALGPTKVWVSHSDKGLVQALGAVAGTLKLPVAGVDADKVGDEDGHSFMKLKVPTLMLHSITQETLAVLHTANDDWKSVKLDDYYDSYRLIATYLAYIDLKLDKEKAPAEAGAGMQKK